MFKDVTGRSVLDEPHHATDQAAYAIVREWTRFEPRYTLGMIVLKAERLFDPEIRLLYWPIFRTGRAGRSARRLVRRAPRRDRDARRRASGWRVMGLALAGIAVALARRRWTLLALLPFQLALVATYAIFFAEPRYRLPIEMLAFPFVALALGELAALGMRWRVARRDDVVVVARARTCAGAGDHLVDRLAGGARRWPGPAGASSLGGDRGGVRGDTAGRGFCSGGRRPPFRDLADSRGAERPAPADRRGGSARAQVRLGGGAGGPGTYLSR